MANAKQTRGSNGRFKPDHTTRNRAIGAASVIGLAAAAVGAALRFGWLDRFFPAEEGHQALDLSLDAEPAGTERAPDAFRPDPTAIPTAAERESLRPATVDNGFGEDMRSEELTPA